MKNILNNKEFKNIRNNQIIKESMDFSNKIGWSDSLLGRLTNKLFSFVAKQAQTVILRRLKIKLENQYLIGILSSYAKLEKKLPISEKNNIAIVDFSLENKNDKSIINSDSNNYITKGEESESLTITIKLPQGKNREDYKTLIESLYNSTWKINDIENQQLDPVTDQFDIIVISENGENTKKIKVIVSIGDEKILSDSININVEMVNKKNNSDRRIAFYNKEKNLFEFNKKIKLDTIQDYVMYIQSDEEDNNIKIEYDEKITEKILEITDIQEEIIVKVTSASGKKTIEYTIKVEEQQGLNNVQEPEQKSITSGENFQLAKIANINEQINDIIKYEKKYNKSCVKGIEGNIMLKISNIIKEERDNLNKIVKYIEEMPTDNTPEDLVKYVGKKEEYIDQSKKLNNLSIELENKSKELGNKEISDDEFFKKINDIINNVNNNSQKNGISEEKANEYIRKIDKYFKSIKKEKRSKKLIETYKFLRNSLQGNMLNNVSEEDLQNMYDNFMSALKDINENYGKNTKYSNYMLKKSYEKINKLNEKINLINERNIFKKTDIKSLLSGEYSKNVKKTVELYGNVDYNKLDVNQIINDFRNDKSLRKNAESLINKEELKVIALKASWMYDSEKYKDQRNNHYTRVNFTTTAMDQNKLKNTWEKYVSQAKAVFAPFFNDDNGNFPQSLDPIALINSDTSFRKNWNQYDKEKNVNNVNNNVSYIDNDNVPTLETLNLMKLTETKNGLLDGFGMIWFNSSHKEIKDLGMIIKKSTKKINGNNLHIFKFVGLFNMFGIKNGINDITVDGKIDEAKFIELVNKNNYSGIDKIKANAPQEKINGIIELYKYYRPSSDNGVNKKIIDNIQDHKNLATFFINNRNIDSGSALKTLNTIQVNVFKNNNNNNKEILITQVKDGKDVLSYDDINNIDDFNKKKYEFKFYASCVAGISKENEKFYVTKYDEELENEKTNMLIKDDKVLSMINNFYNKK